MDGERRLHDLPGSPARAGTAKPRRNRLAAWPPSLPITTGSGARRQGLFLPGQSGLAAPTRYHLHHSRAGRPDPQPQAPWPLGRQAGGVRPRGLQGASCHRVRDQAPQAPPSRRLPLRQARRPIPGDRARRCDRRVAVRGRRPGMPSCPAIAIRVPRRFRDPTYHRADSENGDHIDDPSGGRHQRHRVRDRLVAHRAVSAQANKLRRQRSTTWPSVPRGSGGRRLPPHAFRRAS